MIKYIDAELTQNLIDYMGAKFAAGGGEDYDGFLNALSQLTDNISAEDVASVVHAEWIWDENARDWGLGAFVCSECHCKNDNLPDNRYNPYMYKGSKYCPNCGAKMDKGGETKK